MFSWRGGTKRKFTQEGVAIRSFVLVHENQFQEEAVKKLFAKSRTIKDNLSDLKAQVV